MSDYRYFVHDDEHEILDKEFNNFEDAYDYAQDGLETYIFECPLDENGSPLLDEEDIVWSWDDIGGKEEAMAHVMELHPDLQKAVEVKEEDPLALDKDEFGFEAEDDIGEALEEDDENILIDDDIIEDLKIEIKADDPEEIASFAKGVLGSNCDFFAQSFDEPVVKDDVEFSPEDIEKYEDEVRYESDKNIEIPENPFVFDFEIKADDEVPCEDCNEVEEDFEVIQAPEAKQALLSKEKIAVDAPEEGKNVDPHKPGELAEGLNDKDSEEFYKLCDEIGIKTLDDLAEFRKENPGDLMTALRNFRAELGPDWNLPPEERGMYREDLDEDDMTDEEFIEAFGKALKEKHCLAEKKDDVPRNEYGDAIDYKHLCDKCAYKYDCDNTGNYNHCIPNGYCDFEPEEENIDLEEDLKELNWDKFPDEINYDDLGLEVNAETGGEPVSDGRSGGDNITYSLVKDIEGTLNNYRYDLSIDDLEMLAQKYLNKELKDITQEDLDGIDQKKFEEFCKDFLYDDTVAKAQEIIDNEDYDWDDIEWEED